MLHPNTTGALAIVCVKPNPKPIMVLLFTHPTSLFLSTLPAGFTFFPESIPCQSARDKGRKFCRKHELTRTLLHVTGKKKNNSFWHQVHAETFDDAALKSGQFPHLPKGFTGKKCPTDGI